MRTYLIYTLLIFPVAVLLAIPACTPGVAGPAGANPQTGLAPKQITVGAAASLTDVLKLAAGDYSRRRPGATVYLSFGASSTIVRQIQAGAPIDVFFSADQNQMELLEKAGLTIVASQSDLLSNRLAFVVSQKRWQKGQTVEEIVADGEALFALCDPSVPVGRYAQQYLKAQGWYETLAARAVKLDNARALVVAVDSGNVDLAIVFETDAATARTARTMRVIPEKEGPRIVYPAAIVRNTRNPQESRAFMDYVKSPPALEIFRKAGFTPSPWPSPVKGEGIAAPSPWPSPVKGEGNVKP